METENRLDNMRVVPIMEITPEELIDMKYSRETDCVQCPKCHYIIDSDLVEEWGIDEDDYETMDYDDYDDLTDEGVNKITCPNCHHTDYANKFRTVWTDDIIDAPNCEELVPGIKEAYDSLEESKEGVNKVVSDKETKLKQVESKAMNLQEATIKALHDGLKDDTEVNDVEGLVDDVLVVTDPEITTDEYNEVIERAEEIVEDTPEGDIPLDPTYLGEYLQLCPICGGSFVEDHILEPGTACPICYQIPEAFVMIGKLQAEEEVAEDNGLVDDNVETISDNIEVQNIDELGNEPIENVENNEEPEEPIVEPNEEPEERPTRVRGARQRRTPLAASKEMPTGNILTETRINQALLKDRETNKTYTYKELQDMYKNSNSNNVSFEEYINGLLETGNYIDLKESVDPEEGFEIDEDLAYQVDGLEYKNMRCRYYGDTNTFVFYLADDIREKIDNLDKTMYDKAMKILELEDSLDEIDTNVYRNETVDEMKKYIDTHYKDFLNRLDKVTNNILNESIEQQEDNNEYTLELIFEDKIKELAEHSAFTWEGMSTDPNNLKAIVESLKKNTNIVLPVHFYVFDGRTMNRIYGLTENNAYPDDLKFLSIDLDNWSQLGNLPFYKMQVGARWLDDIVDNNRVRQNKIDGIDDEEDM